MEFNLIDIELHVRTPDPNALRCWLFGRSLDFAQACKKKSCCNESMSCAACAQREQCAWQLVFGQNLANDPEALRRHQKPALPFAFSFREASGELLKCRLVVVGRAIGCLDMLLQGLGELFCSDQCPRGSIVHETFCRDYQGARHRIANVREGFPRDNLIVLSAAGIMESQPWNAGCQEVHLQGPLKLWSSGRQVSQFSFALFARSLMRRVSSLAYYYGDCELECDFSAMSQQAEKIRCTENHFSNGVWPGCGRKIAGLNGYGRFSGDLSGLLPFLVIGTYVNTGKTASFGFGSYFLTA